MPLDVASTDGSGVMAPSRPDEVDRVQLAAGVFLHVFECGTLEWEDDEVGAELMLQSVEGMSWAGVTAFDKR